MNKKLLVISYIAAASLLLGGCMGEADKLLEQKAEDEARLGLEASEAQPKAEAAKAQPEAPQSTPTLTPVPTPTPSPTPMPEPTIDGAVEVSDLTPEDIQNSTVVMPTPTPTPAPPSESDVVIPPDAVQPGFVKLSVATLTFTNCKAYMQGGGTVIEATLNNPKDSRIYTTLECGIFKGSKSVSVLPLFEGELEPGSSTLVKAVFEGKNYVNEEYDVKFLGRMRTIK